MRKMFEKVTAWMKSDEGKKKMKKMGETLAVMAVMVAVSVVRVKADMVVGTGITVQDPTTGWNDTINFLKDMVKLLGLGLLGWGGIEMLLSWNQQDGATQEKALKRMASGLGVAVGGSILLNLMTIS
ncbi:MAG: hypothetical protein J6J86_08635 [Lachnospiraceae bacterium]|nr:hypothetical protein [Lachnospiraceae bacterium]